MVSVIFAVLEVSFGALTTVVKLPRKFLTLMSNIDDVISWTSVRWPRCIPHVTPYWRNKKRRRTVYMPTPAAEGKVSNAVLAFHKLYLSVFLV